MIFQVKSLVQNRFLFFSIFIFLLVGCHNNSHLRTQRILKPNEKSVSISGINNFGAGERNYNNRYIFTQTGVLGSRAELSYLKSNGQSESGPYIGVGIDQSSYDDPSTGIIAGYDYRSYLNKNSNIPLKMGGQFEINVTDGGNFDQIMAHIRPSITTTSQEKEFYYFGASALYAFGKQVRQIYSYSSSSGYEDELIDYGVSSLGVGATVGFEKSTQLYYWENIIPSYQFQIDISFIKNSFRTDFVLPDGKKLESNYGYISNPIFNRESEPLLLVGAGFGMNFISSPKKLEPVIVPPTTLWPNYNTAPEYFDPETGLPVKPDADKLFNPETGEPISPSLNETFNPETGEVIRPINKKELKQNKESEESIKNKAILQARSKNRWIQTNNIVYGATSCLVYPVGIPASILYTELLINSSFNELNPFYVALSTEEKRVYRKAYKKEERSLRRRAVYQTQAACLGAWFLFFISLDGGL